LISGAKLEVGDCDHGDFGGLERNYASIEVNPKKFLMMRKR
jgi:hypothetical protein